MNHVIVDGPGVSGAAEQAFLDSKLFVCGPLDWQCDMGVIRRALVDKRRAFKEPFIEHPPKPPVQKEIQRLIGHAKTLFPTLFPSFKVLTRPNFRRSVMERASFRPMITGPEPLHFDTYGGTAPLVTAYINVSDEPRIYNIGPNFPEILVTHASLLRQLRDAKAKKGEPLDVSYELRQMGQDGEGPLGKKAPRERVELPPSTIWFFNAKTVSHEVVFGRGAVGVSWEVPDCGAKMQADYLRELA